MPIKRILQLFSTMCLFTACFPSAKVAGHFTDQDFEDMARKMSEGPVIDWTIEDLKQKNGTTIVLLDTRERNEYEVSHLAAARWVGFKDFDISSVSDLPKDAQIVTYCSVGYRSERIGEKLQKAGFKHVANLKGGIFDWVNKGNPVVDMNGKPAQAIHGYNEKWGRWLKQLQVVLTP